jgi:thioredoxin reductase (NADPH)
MLTTDVENYPGFPEGISGPEMMELFQKQAERFGTEVLLEDATESISRSAVPIATAEQSFTADAVILATGATAKWLGLPSEQRLTNRGVSRARPATARSTAARRWRWSAAATPRWRRRCS